MDISLFKDIIVIFALSIAAIFVCHRFNLPTIVAFLFTGVISGPHGLGLVKGIPEVNSLASIGIVLLLFIVGMEFSIKKMMEYKHFFWVGGLLQVTLTTAVGFVVAQLLNRPMGESLFLGFLLAMSSTAITISALDQRGETDTPYGRITLGVLIFQDLFSVPIMLAIPLLALESEQLNLAFLWQFFKGLFLLTIVFIAAEKIVPKLLYYVAKTRRRELFLLTVLTMCFSVAWIASNVGLPLSLGAFLAGLIISESEYKNEAVSTMQPFMTIFTSFFFVSIGMLLDISFLFAQPFLIFGIAAAIMIMKTLIASATVLVLKMPLRTALLSGLALSQIGEFSFVLARAGIENGIGTEYYHQLFFAVSFLTMAVTPSMIEWGPQIATFCAKMPMPSRWKTGLVLEGKKPRVALQDHLIVIGYGLSGRNIVRSAKEANIPYTIVDMNPDTVRSEKSNGEPIHYGDATHDRVLWHAHLQSARVLAVVINDPQAAFQIVEKARKINSQVSIIVRTRYIKDTQLMYDLGANVVIPDEFGSAIEVFTRVLKVYDTPKDVIEKIVSDIRIEGYEKLGLQTNSP